MTHTKTTRPNFKNALSHYHALKTKPTYDPIPMTEMQLVHSIIEVLNYTGQYWVWRVNSGMAPTEYKGKKHMIRLAKAGSSDILGIRKSDGKMLAIEVKLPRTRKSLTEKQEMFLECVTLYGGISGVATSPEEALEIAKGNV